MKVSISRDTRVVWLGFSYLNFYRAHFETLTLDMSNQRKGKSQNLINEYFWSSSRVKEEENEYEIAIGPFRFANGLSTNTCYCLTVAQLLETLRRLNHSVCFGFFPWSCLQIQGKPAGRIRVRRWWLLILRVGMCRPRKFWEVNWRVFPRFHPFLSE